MSAALLLLPSSDAQSQPAALDAAPTLSLVEELRIGSVNSPDTGFTGVRYVDVDRDGQVYVLEVGDFQLRAYSPTGRLLRVIGRRGQGPGEFGGVPRIGVKGDTVWAIEPIGGRITLFDRRGRVLSTGRFPEIRVPMSGRTGLVAPSGMRTDGTLASNMTSFAGPPQPPSVGPRDTVLFPRVVYAPTGAPIDTAGWDKSFPPAGPADVVSAPDGSTRSVPRPMSDQPLLVVYSGGRFMVEREAARSAAGATIRVTRITYRGDTVYSKRFAYEPVAYPPSVLDSLANVASRGAFRGGPNDDLQARPQPIPAVAAAIRSKMAFPPFQVPIQASFAGADGSVWLRREDDGRTPRWIVMDPQGSIRGRFTIPATTRLAWASGDTVWAVQPDQDDVEWLVRFRITPGAR